MSPVQDKTFDNITPVDPDFDGLNLHKSPEFNLTNNVPGLQQFNSNLPRRSRRIQPNDAKMAELHWINTHRDTDLRDDYDHTESLLDKPKRCRRPNWKDRYYPTCNSLHEIELSRDYDAHRAEAFLGDDQVYDSFMVNHGYYRDVWVIHQVDVNFKSILKTVRWEHDYDPSTYIQTLMDALVMEKMTASPHIINIYGHCGSAVSVEALPHEVEENIVFGDGYMKPVLMQQDLRSFNQYSPREKLGIALSMAESIADLHGHTGGVIVHGDVQLCQWLRSVDGTLKLGDFNRAEVLDYDLSKKEYCRYYNGHAFGNYRAPEEFAEKTLDEKIDVFSFGNNIYALLTGLWTFYDNENDDQVQRLVIDGKRGFVDPRWKDKSYIESELVEVMEKCWEHDPTKRIDIFQVIELLRGALKQE